MSLTNFTSGISLKLRNKAMSPVFSKKMSKQDQNSNSDADTFTIPEEGSSNMSQLRRLGSDPQILSHDTESAAKPNYKSEGEADEDFTRVKSKIKSKYSRAVPLAPPPTKSVAKAVTTEPIKSTVENETANAPPPPPPNKGTNITFQIPLRAEVTIREDPKKDSSLDAYKAAMLSEKTKLRLQQVSVEHQAAIDKRQVEKEKVEREHEKTLRDLKEEDDSLGDESLSPRILRDSDDSISSTSGGSNASSRKESLDSLPSPSITRKYHVPFRTLSGGSSASSDEKSPIFALTQAEIEQREREKRQLDLFLGQFETSDEEKKMSPISESISPARNSPLMNVTAVENLGAKSLDEKLRILLDPNFQEKDGKLVRKNASTSSSNASPNEAKDFGRNYDLLGYTSPTQSKKANFAASIRGLDKPLKTKVIGLSAAKVNAPMYNADMAARIDTFKQKKQELEKKVSSILQDSSKTKDFYQNDCNKTDEQKVACLRQKNQPFKLASATQRVIVSSADISTNRAAPIAFENPARANIESSLQRLDRNVQQVVELLQDSHMDELTGEHSELAALLNNLQRQANSEPESSTGWSKKQHNIRNNENEDSNIMYPSKSKRGEAHLNSGSRHDNTKADLVRVQEWRTGTGPQLSGQSSLKYSKLYPR